jgi:IclR family mhp operon transcriptional activator
MNENQELRSLKRGLKALTLLNQTENLSITELAKYLNLPRTTAERILLTLLAEGYVQRVPDDRRYRLSSKVCSLSDGFSDDCRIVQIATPLLFRLTGQIGWPLAIATPSKDKMVLRSTTDPATSLWLNRRRVGAEIAMLNSSSGLVAYACASPGEQVKLHELIINSDDPVNRSRASDPGQLDLLVQPVCQNGYAFQPPPNNKPEQSVAVPIYVSGKYVASLLMIYISRAMNAYSVIENYVPHLQRLAERISIAASAGLDDLLDDEIGFPAFVPSAAMMPVTHLS